MRKILMGIMSAVTAAGLPLSMALAEPAMRFDPDAANDRSSTLADQDVALDKPDSRRWTSAAREEKPDYRQRTATREVPDYRQRTADAAKSSNAEAMVLTKMHLTNQMEIQAGEIAQQKAQSSDVKEFGKQLAQHHREADERVQQLALQEGITLNDPAATQLKKQEEQITMNKLRTTEGAAFDQAFSAAMDDGHKQTIADLRKSRGMLKNPRVQELVDNTLPVLETHQQRAQELRATTQKQA